jgi:hypothetical protein
VAAFRAPDRDHLGWEDDTRRAAARDLCRWEGEIGAVDSAESGYRRREHALVIGLPDPDWYFDNVLTFARPGPPPPRLIRGPAAEWRSWWQRQCSSASDVLLRTAARQGFVLATSEFEALGVTRSRARHEVRQGRWTSAGFGAVAPLDIRDDGTTFEATMRVARRRHALACAGAAIRRRGATVSGRSAAILDGLPILRLPRSPELTERDVGLGKRANAHVFSAKLAAIETTEWFGVPVETVGRTLVSLARHGRRDALMAADAALRENLIDEAGIAAALSFAVGWPWVRQARAVLALADPRAESPLESLTRLALHDDGFPPPDLQVWIGIDRVDFYWPEFDLVLEADGRVKYTDAESWRERQREQRLRNHVRQVERVVWSEVLRTWPQTSARLWRAFR